MKAVAATITVQNKKYEYTLKPAKEKGVIRFVCKGANIDQDFLAEDIPALILDLHELIIAEKTYQDNQTEVVRFRISTEDKKKIEKKALADGFDTVSDYLRARALA
jgi:hypothetical protein